MYLIGFEVNKTLSGGWSSKPGYPGLSLPVRRLVSNEITVLLLISQKNTFTLVLMSVLSHVQNMIKYTHRHTHTLTHTHRHTYTYAQAHMHILAGIS